MTGLGRISQLSPLRVKLNGDSQDSPAEAADDMTGSAVGTEVLVETVERRRFVRRVRS